MSSEEVALKVAQVFGAACAGRPIRPALRRLPPKAASVGILVVIIASATARAQSVREHTRPKPDRSTAITESQATELTLTVSEASIRPIQVWVRTAGRIDGAGRTVTTTVSQAEGRLVRVGQRVRAFPPESRSSMYQAWITEVLPQDDHVIVKATLSGPARQDSSRYVLEIVTENVQSLSVPNEAIIETGGKHVVYVQQPGSRYVPREIRPGVQGELYTQVLDGLQAGERVVTFGSFFIDADHKLKGS